MLAWVLCSLLLAPSTSPPDPASLQAALHLLEDEDNTAANLNAALQAFDAALATELSPREKAAAHGYKALAYLRLGDLEAAGPKRVAQLEAGMKEAQEATTLDDSHANGWFLRGALVGRWAQQKGMVKALTHLSDIRGAFQNALKRDPHHAGAALAMGIIEKQVPFLMGGSKSSAEKRFRTVLTEHPHHTRAMLDLAEFLSEEDHPEEAITWARKARDEAAPERPGEWRKFDRPHALALLKQLKAE